MSFTFRRGPVLARALRTCASRSFQPARISSNLAVNTPKPLLSLSLSSIARARFIHSSTIQRQPNAGVATAPAAQTSESFPAVSEFADLSHHGYVHPRIIHSITDRMNIKTMTDVQKLTIAHSVGGSDVLAQAKTGTGKTLAFLVPVLQKILTINPSLAQRSQGPVSRSSARDIRALIISPTRELAEQIAVEARKVASGTGVVVQVAVGGTRKMEALNRVRREGCHILVGTPGRLKDILSDYSSGVSAPNLDVLVLDEADRLLDDGFGPEIESIQELLPDPTGRDRQTLMFSATVPREVMRMVKRTMKPGFQTIKTVSADEVPTHMRVPQKMVSLRGFENAYPAIIEILKKYIDRTAADPSLRPMKALVYFNTTTEVEMAHEAFLGLREDPSQPRSANPLGRRILHIHSKLSQAQRTNYSEAFRRANSAILLSSDVTARGLDFPDVTHVIQVGTPRTRESYIHRLGRTGRAGKEGEGWTLILGGQKGEKRSFIERVGDLPIEDDRSIQAATVDMSQPESIVGPVAETIKQATAALKLVPAVTKEDTYRILLSSTIPLMDRKQDVVDALNNLSRYGWGLEPPAVSPNFAEKLGLSRVPTLNIQERRAPRGLMGDILNATSRSRSGDAGGFRRSRDGFASRRDDTSGGYRSEGFRRRDDMSGGYRSEGPPRRQYDDRSRSSRSRYSFEQNF